MHAPTVRAALHKQCGQSLVEVCVACLALVPLAIGLTYVGQYIHIKQTVQQAAREAAWDAAVSPSVYEDAAPAQSAEQTRLRAQYFGSPATPIATNPQAPASFVDTMLGDYSGTTLLKPDQLTLSDYSDVTSPGPEGVIDTGLAGATKWLSKIPFLNVGVFPPDSNGYITAQVDARTSKATYFKPFNTLDLDFHSQAVLLADGWNADGGGETDTSSSSTVSPNGAPIFQRTVVRSLPPSAAYLNGGVAGGITEALNVVSDLPFIGDFFPMQGLDFGRAAPDVVPYDKLQPYQQ